MLYAMVVIALIFIGGVMVGHFKVFPYVVVEPFVTSIDATIENSKAPTNADTFRWPEAAQGAAINTHLPVITHFKSTTTDADKGMTQYVAGEAFEGYTLFTSTHDDVVRLVDMNGQLIKEWKLSFNKIFPNQKHMISPHKLNDGFFYVRDAHVYPDGSLVAVLCAGGVTPWGAGIVKVDADGNIIWRDAKNYFSDLSLGADGSIYALFHDIRTKAIQGLPQMTPPYLNDTIAKLSPDGKTIDTISIIDAIQTSDFRDIFTNVKSNLIGDYLHTNSIEEITHDNPDISWMRKGNLLLSIRNLNVMVVIDPVTKKAIFASYGPFHAQHAITITPRGSLMVFDNLGNIGPQGATRVIEFDPTSLGIIWSYNGASASTNTGKPLSSAMFGRNRELPNGNALITDAQNGRIIEVTRSGKTVWEFYMRERKFGKNPVITGTTRYGINDLPFIKE